MTQEKENAISKCLSVLDVLYLNFAVGFTQTEISEQTGLNKTAVFRYVNELVRAGYAEQIGNTKRYRPSHKEAQRSMQVMRSLESMASDAQTSIQRITRG